MEYDILQRNSLLRKIKKPTMKNIYNNKSWRTGAVQIHFQPSPIPSIKSNNDTIVENNGMKVKSSRYPTS